MGKCASQSKGLKRWKCYLLLRRAKRIKVIIYEKAKTECFNEVDVEKYEELLHNINDDCFCPTEEYLKKIKDRYGIS